MTRNLELMWLAEVIRADDRSGAWIELATATRSLTEDEALESLIAGAEVNRGCAVALSRAVEAEHPTLALAWQAYAATPRDTLFAASTDLIRVIENSELPYAVIDHCTARLFVWKKISVGKLGGGDVEIDVFRFGNRHWRSQLQRVENESMRVMSAFPEPLRTLGFARWDHAATHLKYRSGLMLDPLDQPLALAIEIGGNRVENANRIRALVAVLFDVGTVQSGELAVAWMLMLASPERPSSVKHVLPQLQFMCDRAVMTDAARADLRKRLAVWWDAAAGKYESQAISIFQIAHRVLANGEGKGGFEAARKAAMKEMGAEMDPEIEAQRGPTLVVMPKDKSTKLDASHAVHGSFKKLVDVPLPLVVARDVQVIRRQLHLEYPHAVSAIDLVLRDLREDKPVTLKPFMLVGGPGAGKSRLIRRLGAMLSLYVFRYDGAASIDGGGFGGVSKFWSSTQPSAPVRAIEQAKHANPIVMVDEIDKAASDASRNGSLGSAMLGFLDPETSSRFRDPSLDAEIDCSRISFCATANDDTNLPAPLKDRFRVIRVPDPTLAHLPQLAANIMGEMAKADEARMYDEPLALDELHVIGRAWKRSGMSMRKLQKIVGATLEARDAHSMRH